MRSPLRHAVVLGTIALARSLHAPTAAAQALEARASFPNSERRTIRSATIDDSYDLLVSLPADYATSGKRYPVLYVLDSWHFPLMLYFQELGSDVVRMPTAVIVTISHGERPWRTVAPLRVRDFVPAGSPAAVPNRAHADVFLAFLEHELIPFVDATYRTDVTDRALLGHSYGGLFALYAMHARPALFGRIVAASPAVGMSRRVAFTWIDSLAFTSPVRLDLSVGEEEKAALGGLGVQNIADFAAALDRAKVLNLSVQYHSYEGETHESVRLRSFPAGLNWVYQGNK